MEACEMVPDHVTVQVKNDVHIPLHVRVVVRTSLSRKDIHPTCKKGSKVHSWSRRVQNGKKLSRLEANIQQHMPEKRPWIEEYAAKNGSLVPSLHSQLFSHVVTVNCHHPYYQSGSLSTNHKLAKLAHKRIIKWAFDDMFVSQIVVGPFDDMFVSQFVVGPFDNMFVSQFVVDRKRT